MKSEKLQRGDAPWLRIVRPEEVEPAEPAAPRQYDERTRELIELLGLAPERLPTEVSRDNTLPEFFVLWYWPVVMRGQRNCRDGTVLKVVDALRWWRRLTTQPPLSYTDDLRRAKDPPLRMIDEVPMSIFQERLRSAVWRRGPSGRWQPLGLTTIADCLARVQTVLDRAGPTLDRKRPGKGLITDVWRFEIDRPEPEPEACFTLAQARQVCDLATRLPLLTGYPPPSWWRTFFGLKFCTGLRISSMLLIEWTMLKETELGWRLDVPAECVPKTDKPDRFALPEWLLAHLLALRRAGGKICPWTMHEATLDKVHRRLQLAAGIKPTMGFNVWRRTMEEQLALLGLVQAREVGRLALNHASERTTNGHYYDIDNLYRLHLPPLWTGPIGAKQGLLF